MYHHDNCACKDSSTISRPGPRATAILLRPTTLSSAIIKAAGIKLNSAEHKALKRVIQSLCPHYLHPDTYVEEQQPQADRLIAQARVELPWLPKYEDAWPARIYLQRYFKRKVNDARRPLRPRLKVNMVERVVPDAPLPVGDQHSAVRAFLRSLTPNLEHHLDAFVESGVKDQKTLQAFLSWPPTIQAEFLDKSPGVLHLTSLEKTAVLFGCRLLTQKGWNGPFGDMLCQDALLP